MKYEQAEKVRKKCVACHAYLSDDPEICANCENRKFPMPKPIRSCGIPNCDFRGNKGDLLRHKHLIHSYE